MANQHHRLLNKGANLHCDLPGKNINHSTGPLQQHTCNVPPTNIWSGVNARKTQTILFIMKTTAGDPDPITVDTEKVPWNNTDIYLGVTLDRCLSLKQHAKANASKARTRGRLIHPLLQSLLLKLRTKMQLYQMTMLLYASPAWSGFLTRNSWDILGKTERTILRTIHAPRMDLLK
ncbi:hypothetical protein J437_LFUL007394 [Ladona fulva]|uniref:Reverse transcriptase n=1 Tax=Ladona fulva TaxID=123851 RepID=A0A8K0K0Q8_LADFU|nr:hypothetical protein J437_LFUL007394 [Ladona fulva]